ncbi:MAG: hypothetical protein V3S33_07070 [Gammaproteobacteria bacterium]
MEYSDQNAGTAGHQAALKGYTVEAARFIDVVDSMQLQRVLSLFSDYRRFLKKRRRSFRSARIMQRAIQAAGKIDLSRPDLMLQEIGGLAHIAACCELFKDWDIPLSVVNRQDFQGYVADTVQRLLASGTISANQIVARLHIADAVRTIQILKLCSLVPIDGRLWRQLSLAAGPGSKDLAGIHIVPGMFSSDGAGNRATHTEPRYVRCSTEIVHPKNTVLIDNDSSVSATYRDYNESQPHKIIAMNQDFHNAITDLPGLLSDRKFGLRNVILAIRIDHLIIPDVAAFFSQLLPVIEPGAILIITMGSGNNLEEFQGRMTLMQKLHSYLLGKRMAPLHFQMHAGDDLEQHWRSPWFGIQSIATFEMLFCKLDKEKLLGGS